MAVAFIVDGQLEKKVVQRLCGHIPVRITNLNGKNVAIPAIVDKAETLLRLLKARYYPVFIIIDRENRPETSVEIEKQIEKSLESRGFTKKDIIVSSPDKMIENWILAGTQHFEGKPANFLAEGVLADGIHGKGMLKSVLGELDINYGETTIGVDMFCSMNFTLCAQRSESFRRFAEQAKPYCIKLQHS